MLNQVLYAVFVGAFIGLVLFGHWLLLAAHMPGLFRKRRNEPPAEQTPAQSPTDTTRLAA